MKYMVSGGDAARKRIRDYSAERARRNKLAESQGFTSLDARAKAIRANIFPSFKARKTDPAEAERARLYSEARKAEREAKAKAEIDAKRKALEDAKGGPPALGLSDEELDRFNRRWSRAHARQDGTRFRGEWPRERRELFYRAFVQWWRVPHDERNFEPTYQYMHDYPEGFEVQHDDNPYN